MYFILVLVKLHNYTTKVMSSLFKPSFAAVLFFILEIDIVEGLSCEEAMDEGIIHISNCSLDAASFTDINYNDCAFVLSIMPFAKTIFIHLRDICELDGGSGKLTTLICKALYETVNKKLDELHITPNSHSLSDLLRFIMDDDQLQKILEFDQPYQKLFRFHFNPNPDASVNHAHLKSKFSDSQSPRIRSNQTYDIVLPFSNNKDHITLDIGNHSDCFLNDIEENGVEKLNDKNIVVFLFT